LHVIADVLRNEITRLIFVATRGEICFNVADAAAGRAKTRAWTNEGKKAEQQNWTHAGFVTLRYSNQECQAFENMERLPQLSNNNNNITTTTTTTHTIKQAKACALGCGNATTSLLATAAAQRNTSKRHRGNKSKASRFQRALLLQTRTTVFLCVTLLTPLKTRCECEVVVGPNCLRDNCFAVIYIYFVLVVHAFFYLK
jgi:hypothetical protein